MTTRVPIEYRVQHQENGFPWCDTCKQPAVFSEFQGNLHSTPEHPFGLPKHLDQSGHEVSMRQWWDPSRGRAEDAEAQDAMACHCEDEAARHDGEYAAGLLTLAASHRAEAARIRAGAAW